MTNKLADILVVEVPTEAGTHWHGQSKAPAALQQGGLQRQLQELGFSVQTISALPDGPQLWRPSPMSKTGVRDEEATIYCMQQVHAALSSQLLAASGSNGTNEEQKDGGLPFFPIVIGGPCTITHAVVSSLTAYLDSTGSTQNVRLGLLWVDSDADLTLPTETSAPGSTGSLDSMTLSHLTRRAGGLESMVQFEVRSGEPLVTPDNVVLFGLDVAQPKLSHFAYLLDNHFRVLTNHAVKSDSARAMKAALQYLNDRCDVILLHFDVDTVDSAEWPLGNYPSYGGLELNTVMEALQLALGHDKVSGLVVTEVNPNNDLGGQMVLQLVEGLVKGFQGRLMNV